MNRSNLIARLAERYPQLSARDIAGYLDAIQDSIEAELAAGGRVELSGFGVFEIIDQPARASRNPRAANVLQAVRHELRFTAAETLQVRVDAGPNRLLLPPQASEANTALEAETTSLPIGRAAEGHGANEQAAQAVDEMVEQISCSAPIEDVNLKALRQEGRR